MHWNDAAEDLLAQISQRTPRPERERAAARLREAAEQYAQDNGLGRVGVYPVITAYIALTPEALRPELPRQLESLGLEEGDYRHLLSE
jgi:hypothetical protein